MQRFSRPYTRAVGLDGMETTTYAIQIFSDAGFCAWLNDNKSRVFVEGGTHKRRMRIETLSVMRIDPRPCARRTSCSFDGKGGLIKND